MWKHSRGRNIACGNTTFTWDPLITGNRNLLSLLRQMRICEDAGMSFEPKVGSEARVPKGSKQEQEILRGAGHSFSLSLYPLLLLRLSLSPGLHIAHLCVSLCIWLILLLSLCTGVFSVCPHTGLKGTHSDPS